MFPEGEHGGVYHTADATLWFFHAVSRYVRATNDRTTLRALLPKMVEVIDRHVRGTRFNIRVDPKDGLVQEFLEEEEGESGSARRMGELATRTRASFNERFWYEEGQYLYDVVDENDAALRPNQLFAIALDHPVLDPSRWTAVVDVVERGCAAQAWSVAEVLRCLTALR